MRERNLLAARKRELDVAGPRTRGATMSLPFFFVSSAWTRLRSSRHCRRQPVPMHWPTSKRAGRRPAPSARLHSSRAPASERRRNASAARDVCFMVFLLVCLRSSSPLDARRMPHRGIAREMKTTVNSPLTIEPIGSKATVEIGFPFFFSWICRLNCRYRSRLRVFGGSFSRAITVFWD